MSKKQIRLVFALNLSLIVLVTIILRCAMNAKLKDIRTIISQSSVSSDTVVSTDLHSLQSSIVDIISKARKSVVSITISKDIKVYVDDPSQLYGP